MLRYVRYEKRKFRGLFMYPNIIMKGKPLSMDNLTTSIFLCTYDIPDSAELRKYLGYFAHMPDHNWLLTTKSYKRLPIKPEDKDA